MTLDSNQESVNNVLIQLKEHLEGDLIDKKHLANILTLANTLTDEIYALLTNQFDNDSKLIMDLESNYVDPVIVDFNESISTDGPTQIIKSSNTILMEIVQPMKDVITNPFVNDKAMGELLANTRILTQRLKEILNLEKQESEYKKEVQIILKDEKDRTIDESIQMAFLKSSLTELDMKNIKALASNAEKKELVQKAKEAHAILCKLARNGEINKKTFDSNMALTIEKRSASAIKLEGNFLENECEILIRFLLTKKISRNEIGRACQTDDSKKKYANLKEILRVNTIFYSKAEFLSKERMDSQS